MLSTRCAWTFFCPQITLMCTDFFPCPLRGPGGREEVTIYHSPFTIHPPRSCISTHRHSSQSKGDDVVDVDDADQGAFAVAYEHLADAVGFEEFKALFGQCFRQDGFW